jgi:chromosome segregation ATPase
MFLKQVTQNELSNLIVEFEQVKENMFETHNHLQTYSLELKTMLKTFKNLDKKLVTIKGQMNWVQHENQNLSNKLKEA